MTDLRRWTELHTGLLLLSLSAATAGAAALSAGGQVRLLVLAVVPLTACLAALTDGFLGMGVGLLGATVSALVMRAGGAWRPAAFPRILTLVLALIVLGWVCGLLGGGIRRLEAALRRGRPADVQPALSSLGLVDEQIAALRADEEIARARRHEHPLGLVAIRLEPRPDTEPAQAQAALRCVSRHLEHRLRRSDAPFALDGTTVAALLPETDAEGVAALLRVIPAAASELPLRDRTSRDAVPVREVGALVAHGLVLGPEHTDGAQLLAAARALLDPSAPTTGATRADLPVAAS